MWVIRPREGVPFARGEDRELLRSPLPSPQHHDSEYGAGGPDAAQKKEAATLSSEGRRPLNKLR